MTTHVAEAVVLKPHDKNHDQTIVKRGGGKHKHDDHGGAWKVAFADFCLALMCLFLVLWLMAARNFESLEQILTEADGAKTDQGKGVMPEQVGGPRGSLIDRFPMPHTGSTEEPGDAKAKGEAHTKVTGEAEPVVEMPKIKYDSPSDLAALSKALTKMSAEAGLSSNLESVITPYGLRVMLHDTDRQGMFVRGSAVPTDKFRALLRRMGPLFRQMENQMLIVGHTDSLQYADRSYAAFSNWTLSANRRHVGPLAAAGRHHERRIGAAGGRHGRPRAARHQTRRRRRQPPHRTADPDHGASQDDRLDVRHARKQQRPDPGCRHRLAGRHPAAKAAQQARRRKPAARPAPQQIKYAVWKPSQAEAHV